MLMIFAKILTVFSISLIGYATNKLKWLPIESTRYLSALLINISSPCLIIYSMSQQSLSEDTLTSVVQTASLMLIALIVATILSVFIVKIIKSPREDQGVYQALLVLTNNGFMGYPLSLAVFGEKGLFLMIVANAVFTIYLYSVGVMMLISGNGDEVNVKTALKSIFSIPVVASVTGLGVFIFGIQLPSLLVDFLDTVGGITIPLSMLIIGIQLAESKAREVLENKHLLITLILKLVVYPALLFGLLVLLPFQPLVLCIVIFAMAMPSAAVIPVLAEMYHSNAKLAAQAVFITTMFSVITIPIIGILLIAIMGV